MIPEILSGWTPEVLHDLLARAVFEDRRLEFKEMLPHGRDRDGRRRLRGTIAAFANTEGGFVVIGVRDDRTLSAADRLTDCPAADEVPRDFGMLASACTPPIQWTRINPPLLLPGSRVVHVFHVPQSGRRPHGIEEDGRWWFPMRTDRGNDAMRHDDLCAQFSDLRQRESALARLRAELVRVRDFAERQNRETFHPAEFLRPATTSSGIAPPESRLRSTPCMTRSADGKTAGWSICSNCSTRPMRRTTCPNRWRR